MPKLDEQQQQVTDQAEGFRLLEPGLYAARLQKVEEKPGTEAKQWSWEFGAIHDLDGERHPGRQWVNTSLSPKAAWKMKEVFDALGYSVDSATEEMIGEWAVLVIEQHVAEKGRKAGKLVNGVQEVRAFDAAEWPFDPAEVPAASPAEAAAAAAAGGGDDF